MPRRRNTGSGCIYRKGGKGYWWIAWSQDGQRHKISTGTRIKAEAEAVLHKKLAGRAAGVRTSKGIPITVRELVDLVLHDYEANHRKSGARMGQAGVHLCRLLGASTAASSVDEATVTAYVAARQHAQAKPATINRELACLRRGFRLAVRARRLERRPDFSLLQERNARKGFFEDEQYLSVLPHLDEDVRPLVEVAYHTGWRRHELISRQRRHLDLDAGWLRLEPGETKNGEGRMFPLTPELVRILGAQEERTKAFERRTGRMVTWLFHRSGEQIRYFRRSWLTAVKAAGCPGRRLHDFRRTAIRNMERAGVPRTAGMAMSGHLTDAIYRRYSIVDEAVLKEAAVKMAQLGAGKKRR